MKFVKLFLVIGLCAGVIAPRASLGQSPVPPDVHGDEDSYAIGYILGNLVKANVQNNGRMAAFGVPSEPWGSWPTQFERHIDGIFMYVGASVPATPTTVTSFEDYLGTPKTRRVTPIQINYVRDGVRTAPNGDVWAWLPLPGFHNPERRDPVTGGRSPSPALASDATSWPTDWPDRYSNPDDPGWPNAWNGYFGKNVFNSDEESYFIFDDYANKQYHLSPSGQPYSQYGVYYPSNTDPNMGGLGLQVETRVFQWANILAEDAVFLVYRINNVGDTAHDSLYFNQMVNWGMPPEGDEQAAFDPRLDLAWGWDSQGIGIKNGVQYQTGYTGFAFLESPTADFDGMDNDLDGLADESRFSGAGMRIDGQEAIRAYVLANYDTENFRLFYGTNGQSFDQVLESRPAYTAGVWFTGDENLDWTPFSDDNGNGVWDEAELLNNDLGLDGLGPNDFGYPGRDTGEGNGRPDCLVGAGCEPNFDALDIDEGDQIGLTGFMLENRPFFTNGQNLINDPWMWENVIKASQFDLDTEQTRIDRSGIEVMLVYSSGPVVLPPNSSNFFSNAWLFGFDEEDFLKNRRTVQKIYNADYQFALPPLTPTLTAIPGDGQVVLSWDATTLNSFDRFTQKFDFEGFKLYRGTDENLSDAQVISDIRGVPTFRKPIGQWDLKNGITGTVRVLENEALFDLGSDTGLEFSYVDRDVKNGMTYYYAIVAYDHGDLEPGSTTESSIDPQENVFNFTTNLAGEVTSISRNAAIVTPRSRPLGYVSGAANEDLSRPNGYDEELSEYDRALGTGSIQVNVLDADAADPDGVYRMTFYSAVPNDQVPEMYLTTDYTIENRHTGEVLVEPLTLSESTPVVDGFMIDVSNDLVILDPSRTGWVSDAGTASEQYSLNPQDLDGYGHTNWRAEVRQPIMDVVQTPWDYELRWADSTQTTDAYTGGHISVDLPVWCTNRTLEAACKLLVRDANLSGAWDAGDIIVIYDRIGRFGPRQFRFEIVYNGANDQRPAAGDVFRISQSRPFANGDYFEFTLTSSRIDTEQATNDLDLIAVVPNPYVGANAFEPSSPLTGRGPRRLQFIHLPRRCTIRIYNVRGELLRTLEHDGVGSDGALFWDMLAEGGQEIAYGTYFFHVDAPDIGERVGKFSIVK